MKRKGMHETGGFQAVPEQPPAGKKSRKGLIAGGIIGGILLLVHDNVEHLLKELNILLQSYLLSSVHIDALFTIART